MNLTPVGFWVILLILCTLAIVVVTAEHLHDRWDEAEDAAPGPDADAQLAQDLARYFCAGHGCVMKVIGYDESGTNWACFNCGRSSWVPCADVYDQDGVA